MTNQNDTQTNALSLSLRIEELLKAICKPLNLGDMVPVRGTIENNPYGEIEEALIKASEMDEFIRERLHVIQRRYSNLDNIKCSDIIKNAEYEKLLDEMLAYLAETNKFVQKKYN